MMRVVLRAGRFFKETSFSYILIFASVLFGILFLLPSLTYAAVAFDAFSSVAQGTGNLSWTHTPVGTPRGIIVLIAQNVGTTDEVSTVTYGGTGMTEIASFNCDTTGEPGCVYAYFLGSSIPTGAQTVSVTVTGASAKRASAISLTATANTEIVSSVTSINADTSNPSATLSLSSRTSFVAEVLHSGQNAVTGITPLTNWTSRLENDYGNQTAGWYTYDIIGTSDVTVGWTQTNDDAAIFAVGASEVAFAPTVTTDFATNIAPTNATLRGEVTATGGASITQHGFAYATSPSLSTGVSTTTLGTLSGASPFSGNVSSLSADTTYYYRAYATNGAGTGYGTIRSFFTGNATITRKIRLFGSYRIKFVQGRILLYQR